MFNCAKCQSQWDLRLLLHIKKKTKILKNVQIQKNLKKLMKSRSNSSNKAVKQIVENKTVTEI